MPPERDLFANFERMRREMDEIFGDVFDRTGLAPRRRGGFSPAVDVFYEGEPPRAVVHAELAGIDPQEIGLEIDFGPFRRTIPLGADVVAEEARATYRDGILRVELPLVRAEQRTRTVPIEVPDDDTVEGR